MFNSNCNSATKQGNLESFDKNQFTPGVFVDLSNAFDTVNHQILINKLKYFGITEIYFEPKTIYIL